VPKASFSTLHQQAVDWLLQSVEPGIRMQTRRDLLDEKVELDPTEVASGPLAAALLAGQRADGGFGVHPYKKWSGAHWRLVSLIELGLGGPHEAALRAASTVLDWLTSSHHRDYMPTVKGLYRRHASMDGNAVAVCVRLGMADDPRVQLLATSMIEWQWPDGGWNCDKSPKAKHSSFHESLPPVWGLTEYARATGNGDAGEAARRATDFFLDHHLMRSHTTGEVADTKWLQSPYPAYWHYNSTQALSILARVGALPDPRADEAVAMLREGQQADGTWHARGSQYWSRSGDYWDPAGWERTGPSEMLTLNALRVLRAADA
jgi:hypothetical protein